MIHNAPKISTQHVSLINSAILDGIDIDHLKRFLWIINAHDSLISFPRICRNISNIIKLISPLDKTSLATRVLNDSMPVINWVIENQSVLTQLIGPDFNRQPSGPRDHPVIGLGSTRHPLYTTLWNTAEDHAVKDDYQILQGHLLLAHAGELFNQDNQLDYEAYGDQEEWKGFPNSPYLASLAVRKLSEALYAPIIKELKVSASPYNFALSLNTPPSARSKPLLDSLNNLKRFLQKHHGLESWVMRNRNASGNTSNGAGPRVTGYVEISPQLIKTDFPFHEAIDLLENSVSTAIINEIGIDHLLQMERLNDDLAPDEVDQHEMLLIDYNTDQTGTVSANSSAQQRHIAMANQLFPWSYQQLTIAELSEFLNRLAKWFKKFTSEKKSKILSELEQTALEAMCLIRVMVFTGSDYDRAIKTIICLDNQPNRNTDVTYLFERNKPGKWHHRAMSPDYKSQDLKSSSPLDRPRTDFFALPDLSYTNQVITRLVSHTLEIINPLETPPSQFPLIRNSANFRQYFLRTIAKIDPSRRITEHKLSMFLFNRILDVSQGDICAASIICGRPHPLARVRMFYSVNAVNELEKLYRLAIEELSSQLMAANQHTAKLPQLPIVQNPYSIGSRHCPTYDTVKNSVACLKKSLISNRNAPIENGFHNQFVLWALWHFNFATACRAIKDPYIPTREIDCATGVGVLSDKDDGTGYKSRLIWIPPFMLDLMSTLELHLSKVIEQNSTVRYSSHLPYFLKTVSQGKLLAEPVQPRTLKPIMAPFLPYPANFHRRFMRTTLLERGCPTEVVDAWMGHWHAGEEPWGPYSSFSFAEYRSKIKEYLVPILEDLGLDGFSP